MTYRPTGPQFGAVTAPAPENFQRQVQQFAGDVARESITRRFFFGEGQTGTYGRRDSFLIQVDDIGLAFYCKTVTTAGPAWRKIADLDCDGNFRTRGAHTPAVAFPASEDL